MCTVIAGVCAVLTIIAVCSAAVLIRGVAHALYVLVPALAVLTLGLLVYSAFGCN